MKRYLWIALATLGIALQTLPAAAQGRVSGLVSSEAARRNGLELAWHTHAQVNRSNGRVTNITQFVGEWVYYEVKLGKLTWRYSERDRTPDDRAIAGELTLPEAVRERGDPLPAGDVVRPGERPAEGRAGAQGLEHPARHERALAHADF